jgi:hypothetical protein
MDETHLEDYAVDGGPLEREDVEVWTVTTRVCVVCVRDLNVAAQKSAKIDRPLVHPAIIITQPKESPLLAVELFSAHPFSRPGPENAALT